jgi:hypothetical protein
LDSSPLFSFTNQHHQIQPATSCPPYVMLKKTPNHNIQVKEAISQGDPNTSGFKSQKAIPPLVSFLVGWLANHYRTDDK